MAHQMKDLYTLLQAAEQSEPIQPASCVCPAHPVSAASLDRHTGLSTPQAHQDAHAHTSHHHGTHGASLVPVEAISSGISSAMDLSVPLSLCSTPSSNTGAPHSSQPLTSDNPIAPNAMALEMARLNYLHQLQQFQQWHLNSAPSMPSSAASASSVSGSGTASPATSAMDVTTASHSSAPVSDSVMPGASLPSLLLAPSAPSASSLVSASPLHPLTAHFATSSVLTPSITIPLPIAPGSESQREQLIRTLRDLFPEVDASGASPSDVIALGEALRPLLCEMCGHEEPNKLQLTVHHKNHKHRSGSYKCDQPRCSFDGGDSFSNLVSHRQLQHRIRGYSGAHDGSEPNPPSSSKASTPMLPEETPDSKSPRKSYKCQDPECESTFQSYSGLKYHQLLHSGAKEHKCTWPGCGAAFTNSSGLKIHKMTHDPSSKSWKCNWEGCRAAFTTSSALSTHIRTHTGAKPYQCTWSKCEKNFARADHLKIHLRSHTNERPYVCEACGKGFTNSSGLRTHEKTHRHHASSSTPAAPELP